MAERATVFIVDDDEQTRKSLVRLFRSAGYDAIPFASAREFLDSLSPCADACLILDLRMPDMGGLELQDTLKARGISLPLILYTGHADVPVAVRAMQAGAFEVIEKPFSGEFLVERVRLARERHRKQHQRQELTRSARDKLGRLSRRELEVANLLADGFSAPEVGRRLHISPRTVETHRVNALNKLCIRSVAELAKLILAASLDSAG